jgi:hypothetical protein
LLSIYFNLRWYNPVCNGKGCNSTAADGEAGFLKIPGLFVEGAAGQTVRNEVACLCCSGASRGFISKATKEFTVFCVTAGQSSSKAVQVEPKHATHVDNARN